MRGPEVIYGNHLTRNVGSHGRSAVMVNSFMPANSSTLTQA